MSYPSRMTAPEVVVNPIIKKEIACPLCNEGIKITGFEGNQYYYHHLTSCKLSRTTADIHTWNYLLSLINSQRLHE